MLQLTKRWAWSSATGWGLQVEMFMSFSKRQWSKSWVIRFLEETGEETKKNKQMGMIWSWACDSFDARDGEEDRD